MHNKMRKLTIFAAVFLICGYVFASSAETAPLSTVACAIKGATRPSDVVASTILINLTTGNASLVFDEEGGTGKRLVNLVTMDEVSRFGIPREKCKVETTNKLSANGKIIKSFHIGFACESDYDGTKLVDGTFGINTDVSIDYLLAMNEGLYSEITNLNSTPIRNEILFSDCTLLSTGPSGPIHH